MAAPSAGSALAGESGAARPLSSRACETLASAGTSADHCLAKLQRVIGSPVGCSGESSLGRPRGRMADLMKAVTWPCLHIATECNDVEIAVQRHIIDADNLVSRHRPRETHVVGKSDRECPQAKATPPASFSTAWRRTLKRLGRPAIHIRSGCNVAIDRGRPVETLLRCHHRPNRRLFAEARRQVCARILCMQAAADAFVGGSVAPTVGRSRKGLSACTILWAGRSF